MLSSCNPSPFEDPKPDIEESLTLMTARIEGEEALKQLEATEYERKHTHLRRFLVKGAYDIDTTLKLWKNWVTWRRGEYV
jgi:hypothetical protein